MLVLLHKPNAKNPSGSMERDDSNVVVDVKVMRMMGFKNHLKGIDSSNTKLVVDKYLAENCEDVLDEKFDILALWKVNSPQYRVLSRIAQHVLAIPVSIVALESTFGSLPKFIVSTYGESPHLWSKLAPFFIDSN